MFFKEKKTEVEHHYIHSAMVYFCILIPQTLTVFQTSLRLKCRWSSKLIPFLVRITYWILHSLQSLQPSLENTLSKPFCFIFVFSLVLKRKKKTYILSFIALIKVLHKQKKIYQLVLWAKTPQNYIMKITKRKKKRSAEISYYLCHIFLILDKRRQTI